MIMIVLMPRLIFLCQQWFDVWIIFRYLRVRKEYENKMVNKW